MLLAPRAAGAASSYHVVYGKGRSGCEAQAQAVQCLSSSGSSCGLSQRLRCRDARDAISISYDQSDNTPISDTSSV